MVVFNIFPLKTPYTTMAVIKTRSSTRTRQTLFPIPREDYRDHVITTYTTQWLHSAHNYDVLYRITTGKYALFMKFLIRQNIWDYLPSSKCKEHRCPMYIVVPPCGGIDPHSTLRTLSHWPTLEVLTYMSEIVNHTPEHYNLACYTV